MGYPHPYFGHKILVFFGLQAGLRCKIVKTKEFPAKSSRIRSYGQFRPLLAERCVVSPVPKGEGPGAPSDEGVPGR
jgi:hypothetical protein